MASRPAEYAIDSKWDQALDVTIRRVVYGSLAGGVAALLLFRGPAARTAAVAFGAGFGAGSAYQQTQALWAEVIKGPSKS